MPIYDSTKANVHSPISKIYSSTKANVHSQITKIHDSTRANVHSLIYTSAPEWLFQDGKFNTEYITGFTNGLTLASYEPSLKSTATTPSCDLSGVTKLRITGSYNATISSYYGGDGIGYFILTNSYTNILKIPVSLGDNSYYETGWCGFDTTIDVAFTENDTIRLAVDSAYWGGQTGNANLSVKITGIYPVETN